MYYERWYIMADPKELKPVSFRIDDETKEQIRQISQTIGGNQQETMTTLINAYYMQQQQSGLPEYKGSIDQFQAYVTSIVTLYTNALQANHDMRDSVMAEFETLLKSKDMTIQQLQDQLTAAKKSKEDATISANTYKGENQRLNEYIDSLKTEYESKLTDMNDMLSDKDSLNKALVEAGNNLKAQIATMVKEHEEIAQLRSQMTDMESKYTMAINDKVLAQSVLKTAQDDCEHKIAQEQQQLELDYQQKILDLERKHQKQLQETIDSYQGKYLDLLNRINKDQQQPISTPEE